MWVLEGENPGTMGGGTGTLVEDVGLKCFICYQYRKSWCLKLKRKDEVDRKGARVIHKDIEFLTVD